MPLKCKSVAEVDFNFGQNDDNEGGENVGGKGTKGIRSKPRCEDAGGAFLPPPP